EVVEVQVITIQRDIVHEPHLNQFDYFEFGFQHQVTGEYYDAILDYGRSLELDPSLAASHLNRGVAYEQLGNNAYSAMVDFSQWMMRDNMYVVKRIPLNDSTNLTVNMSEGYRYDIPLNLNDGDVVSLSAISLNEDE